MGFCLGNAIKYIWRDGQKAGEDVNDDLRKAIWYIQREIDKRIDEMELEKQCNIESGFVKAEKPTEVPQKDVVPNHPLEYLKKKADEGDAEAQWILGNAYLLGRGVEKNKEEAHRLWKLSQQKCNYSDLPQNPIPQTDAVPLVTKSASLPDANRQYEMGNACAHGDGMPLDLDHAREWWTLAAAQGNTEAQEALDAYTPPAAEIDASLADIRKLAAGGDRIAQLYLSECYRHGWYGLSVSPHAASIWHNRANEPRTDEEAQ